MENIEEKTCLCALNRIFGFEPKIGLALISHLGSATEVFRLDSSESDRLLGPYSKYRGQICRKAVESATRELDTLAGEGIIFCGITEAGYPPLLKECEDPPVGLYIRSSTPAHKLWQTDSIAVVGTRDISTYGREWCRKTVKGLASTGCRPAIVSGLALGVDIEAHKEAMESGIPTIAVMATGPDSIYPYRHRAIAEKIASTPGCALITDYPPGTAPLPLHFLRRNRIIAGISRAVILIESKIRGGGMMTCRLAYSYNRDVYALPGRVDDIRSQGCNELIRNKIAEPVTSISSLADSLGMGMIRTRSRQDLAVTVFEHYRGSISGEELKIMAVVASVIEKKRGITVEDIGIDLGIGYRKASEITGLLEIDGFITIDLLQRCSINPKNM